MDSGTISEKQPQKKIRRIIVAIHGVRRGTSGNWQHDFQNFVADLDRSIMVSTFFYNRIPAIKGFGIAFLRKIKLGFLADGDIKNFAVYLQKLRAAYPTIPISILAHSNGTYITLEALEKFHIAVDKIVLVQPVTSRKLHKTNIEYLAKRKLFDRLFVWSSKNDKVIGKLVRFVTFGGHLPGYGMAGYSGMVREGHKTDLVEPPVQPYPQLNVFNTVTDEPHGGVLDSLDQYGQVLFTQLNGAPPGSA